MGDKGMWTIFEIVKRPIAQTPSQFAAKSIIERLKIADEKEAKK